MKPKNSIVFLLVVMLVFGFNSTIYPQDKGYPNEPISILVPYEAGGGVDLFFRLFSEELTKTWKVPVNIINKVGGGGSVAGSEVANAKKDGYTFLGTMTGQLAVMTVANPKGPVNLLRDFDPVAINYGYVADVMVTRSESKFKALEDVVVYSREKPKELILGTGNVGTNIYLEAKMLNRLAKIDITILPLGGTAVVITQLLGGHVDLGNSSDVAVGPYVAAGKIRVLVSTVIKSSIFPNVPTYAEKGYPEIDLVPSIGLFGPKGLPSAITKTWDNAIVMIRKKPEFVASVNKLGYSVELLWVGSEKLINFSKEEVKRYSRFTPEELGWKK